MSKIIIDGITYEENAPANADICRAMLEVYRNEDADADSRKMVVHHFLKLSRIVDSLIEDPN